MKHNLYWDVFFVPHTTQHNTTETRLALWNENDFFFSTFLGLWRLTNGDIRNNNMCAYDIAGTLVGFSCVSTFLGLHSTVMIKLVEGDEKKLHKLFRSLLSPSQFNDDGSEINISFSLMRRAFEGERWGWRKSVEDEDGKAHGKMLICGKFAVMRVACEIRESSQPWTNQARETETEKAIYFKLSLRLYF